MDYKWCAIDAEGDVGGTGLLGVAFYSDFCTEYVVDTEVVKSRLLEHARAGYTFLAHNAQYDLPVIFWQLNINMKAVYFNGRFNRGEWRYDQRKPMAQLWDTLSLSGGISLAKLGNALGIRKYDTPQKLRGIDPDRYTWFCDAHNRGECEECYAIRDAEIVYRFVTSLTDQLAAWGVKPHRKISGIAVATWRALDQPSPILLRDWNVRKLSREAYYGGRVETFKLGHISPCYTADVVSMYPSVMLTTPYPDPAAMVYVRNPSVDSLPLECEGVADVELTVPTMYLPPLPYSHRGERMFPIGRLRGSWTILELRYALSLGCTVHRVHRLAFAHRSLYPFTNYIGMLWSMREAYKQSNDPRQLFAKLLMNNLYGRLGMREEVERQDVFMSETMPKGGKGDSFNFNQIDGQPFWSKTRSDNFHNQWANVLWAAQTTAAARVRLHSYLTLQGDGLVYCDTDSVFSTRPIVGVGEGLGSLSDPTQYQSTVVAAPKLYALQELTGEWHAKAKGVSKEFALEYLRTGSATYRQPVKPRGQMQRGIAAGTWIEVTREHSLRPHRRHPTDPTYWERELGWSDTSPPVVPGPWIFPDRTLSR